MNPGTLLGRANEIAVLHGLIDGESREGSVLLVTGEPGIGKSALLTNARTRARGLGYRVLSVSGVESETHLPFGGLQQMLSPLMAGIESLPPAERDALSTALGLFDGPRPDLFLIAEAALDLLVLERAERRVLVMVDDVHWLDPQSHQVVTFLAHRSAATGLVIVAAARSGHEGPFVSALFPTLEVIGVDEDTAEAILQTQARDLTPADRRRVRHEARGNPLALLELPVSWGEGQVSDGQPPTLSARLEQAFAGRISQLPPETRDLLLIAATGSSNDIAEILAATETFRLEAPSADVLSSAVSAGLIVETGPGLTFRHPLVRSGVLQTETVTRRQMAHRALSDALESDLFRSTWHRAQSIVGPDDQVADDLEATVAESLARGAVMSAISSLERAAHLTSTSSGTGRRLLQAAEHAFEIGRADLVDRLVREASATDLSEIELVRMVWLKESLNDDMRPDAGRVQDLCASARRAADHDDVDLALNILVVAALRCWWAETGTDARNRILETLDGLPVTARDDPRYPCVMAVTEPVLRGHEITQLLAAVDLDAVTDADALRTYGMAAYAVGDYVLATDLFDRSGQLLRESGRLGLLTVVLALQFHIRLDLGDWTGSAAAAEEVDRVAVETGQSLFAFNNVLVESRGLALHGEWETALELVVGAEDDAARLRLNDALCLSFQTRGAAMLSAGRPAEAFNWLKRQFDPADAGHHLRESFAGVALLAEAAIDCGKVDEARAIVERLEKTAAVTPAPMLQVNLLYARAVLADPEAAEQLYVAALARDLSRWPWVRARLSLEYGRWLRGAGRPREAAPHLRGALDVFSGMGAARWTGRAAFALAEVDAAVADGVVDSED